MGRRRIALQADEEEELRRRLRAGTVSVRERRRSAIVLLSAEGLTQQQIAERLGISRLQVNRWVGRFSAQRWSARSRGCRWGSATFVPRPMITCATAP